LFWFGEPEVVSMVGAPMGQVNDHELPDPLQPVVVGGHVWLGVPSMSHDMDEGLPVAVALNVI
jgi:hypothetical protein